MAKNGEKIVVAGKATTQQLFQQNVLNILTVINNNIANLNDTICELNYSMKLLKDSVVRLSTKK